MEVCGSRPDRPTYISRDCLPSPRLTPSALKYMTYLRGRAQGPWWSMNVRCGRFSQTCLSLGTGGLAILEYHAHIAGDRAILRVTHAVPAYTNLKLPDRSSIL